MSANFDEISLFPSRIRGWISSPTGTHVRNADGSEILFDCVDEPKPLQPSYEDLQLAWLEALGYYGYPVVGYHHQVFRGTSCLGTPIDEAWWVEGFPPWSPDYYYVELSAPTSGSYCWRVRGVDYEFGGAKAYAEDYEVSDWTDCCCFDVVDPCTPLLAPTITEVGGTACGGSTTDATPTLRWSDAINADGYRWEVLDAAGIVVDEGTSGANVTVASVGPLTPGIYTAQVQAMGDGTTYCDSNWSSSCSFEVIAPCTTLQSPTITEVGSTTCGGSTADTTPVLRWSDVIYEDGYRWQVRNAAGTVIDEGTSGANVTVASVGPLTPGIYTAQVQAIGDGTTYCDSNWSSSCSFEVMGPCTSLQAPTVTEVGDTTCGGATEITNPTLRWTDGSDEGYRWHVRDTAGAVIDSGTTARNRTYATVGELEPGAYSARVQARGDGEVRCDSAWSADCSFTIGDVEDPVEGPVDFDWWPVDPKQGQQVRFADLTEGTPISWFWDFGDGWTSDQKHPGHVFDTPGKFTVTRDVELETGHIIESKTITVAGTVECGDNVCEGGETAWSCPADCALAPNETGRAGGSDRHPTVPAAAGGLRGANGTRWYTEGWVHNPGEEPARFILEYTPRNETSILQAGPFDLEPGHTIYWDNIVEDLFHSTGSGGLWIDSTEPVIFLARTYTLDPGNLSKSSSGTFGAAQMATRERLTVGRGEGKLYLIGLREDGEFRSNLHLQNIDEDLEITVGVEVFDNTGTLLSRQTFPIGGHSLSQQGLGQNFDISGVASAYAALEVIEGGGRLNSWASVIDNITGDFTFTDAVHSNQVAGKAVSEQHYLVAAVAHTTGVLKSVWRSGLDIFNEPTFPSQTVTLRFVAEYDRTGVVGEFLEKTVTVPAGEQLSWDDVLVDLFGVPENAKTQGALHIFSQNKLVVNSRTHNKRSDGGSLGMGLPGLTSGDLISADGKAGIMPGLTNSGGTRTNVGLAEYSGRDTPVSILFYSTDQENQLLNRNDPVERNVPADDHLQILNIFELVEDLRDITVEKIKAEVWVEGGGSIYSYATTIDNETGDPTAFTAAKE